MTNLANSLTLKYITPKLVKILVRLIFIYPKNKNHEKQPTDK